MENAVGIESSLFGGPPELGNILKLANSQIGFMTIFAHPLFQNVTDIIPAMGFAAAEILSNKAVWFKTAEHEKRKAELRRESETAGTGTISPRSQSPTGANRKPLPGKEGVSQIHTSPMKHAGASRQIPGEPDHSPLSKVQYADRDTESSSLPPVHQLTTSPLVINTAASATGNNAGSGSSGAFSGENMNLKPQTPPTGEANSNNTVPPSQLQIGDGNALTTKSVQPAGSGENQVTPQPGSDAETPQTDGMNEKAESNLPGSQNATTASYSASKALPTMAIPFAMSRPSELTRGFNSSRNPQGSPEGGAAPLPHNSNIERTSTATSGEGTTSTTDVGTRLNKPAMSPSTESTSFLSAESDEPKWPPNVEHLGAFETKGRDFEAKRARAASAPTQAPGSIPGLDSRDSSKQDIRTNVFGRENYNGDASAKVGTMGRRRSRIRLAFWKKRTESEEC